jgi:hypothetical protein
MVSRWIGWSLTRCRRIESPAGKKAGVESTPSIYVNGRRYTLGLNTESLSLAIDDEPFDSSVSETIRIVYGKSSADGMTASSAR